MGPILYLQHHLTHNKRHTYYITVGPSMRSNNGLFFSFILFLLFWVLLIGVTWYALPVDAKEHIRTSAVRGPGAGADDEKLVLPEEIVKEEGPLPVRKPGKPADIKDPEKPSNQRPGVVPQQAGAPPDALKVDDAASGANSGIPLAVPVETGGGSSDIWDEPRQIHSAPGKDAPAYRQSDNAFTQPAYTKANKRTQMLPAHYDIALDAGEVYLTSLVTIPSDSRIFFEYKDANHNTRLLVSLEDGDQDMVLGNSTSAALLKAPVNVWYQVPAGKT
jgi:hypothetical protein